MLKFLSNSKDWILILLGIILIMFAVFNLIDFNPFTYFESLQETPAVEQEGFAPLFIPVTHAQTGLEETTSTNAFIPDRIVIEKIELDAPVEEAHTIDVDVDGQQVTQFLIPEEFAAGWHEGSAALGVVGNTVISGHHNAFGKVFAKLVELEVGDEITMLSGTHEFHYTIVNKMIMPEKNELLEVRLQNARWILPSTDERLTLVTCWPANSNTHPPDPGGRPLASCPPPTPAPHSCAPDRGHPNWPAHRRDPFLRKEHAHPDFPEHHRAQRRALLGQHPRSAGHGRQDHRILQSRR